jgi:FkbM family methyltransferase
VGKMDYGRHDIFLHVDSLVEQSVRLNSCRKEPDTVEWVETFLREGDVLFDVGANVGAYSLVAAKFHGGKVKVYAFEPAFANYVQLCKNIILNGCQQTVVPLPLALSDRTTVDTFNYRDLIPGSALHTFGEAVGDDGEAFQPEFNQHVLSFRIDDLLGQFPLPAPDHLKIDVDGLEAKVLEGARRTLAGSSVRSIIVELREDRNGHEIADLLAGFGFRLHSKQARWTAGLFNYVFSR